MRHQRRGVTLRDQFSCLGVRHTAAHSHNTFFRISISSCFTRLACSSSAPPAALLPQALPSVPVPLRLSNGRGALGVEASEFQVWVLQNHAAGKRSSSSRHPRENRRCSAMYLACFTTQNRLGSHPRQISNRIIAGGACTERPNSFEPTTATEPLSDMPPPGDCELAQLGADLCQRVYDSGQTVPLPSTKYPTPSSLLIGFWSGTTAPVIRAWLCATLPIWVGWPPSIIALTCVTKTCRN